MVDSKLFEAVQSTDWHVKAVVAAVTIIVSLLASDWIGRLRLSWRLRKYPLVNTGWGPKAQMEFYMTGDKLLHKGLEMYKDRPFRVNDFSQSGAKLIVSPKYVDEVKNHPSLDFTSFVRKDFYANYPGFEPFNASTNGEIFQSAVRQQLAQVLALTIVPMAREIPKTLDMVLGKPTKWTETPLQPAVQKCVGRLTARIFLGPRFMDDPDWQYICAQYTADVFVASQKLNSMLPFLRPVMQWFIPECRKVRAQVKQARALIEPEVERRMDELRKHGGPRRRVLDSVDWFVACSMQEPEHARKFDIPCAEISLAMASIHTTMIAVMCLLTDLLENPQYTQELRDECVSVMKEVGRIDKTALFKMVKMDSFLRESMRIRNSGNANMPRLATEDVQFSDGTVIPKGSYIMIAPTPMSNPELYPDPSKFDGYRFLRLREAEGAENKYQAVTTSPEFTVFGHGRHACPGRFFATNEIKLLFTYMLLYYDFKVPENQSCQPMLPAGMGLAPNRDQMLCYKSRTPEVDMMNYCAMEEAELEGME